MDIFFIIYTQKKGPLSVKTTWVFLTVLKKKLDKQNTLVGLIIESITIHSVFDLTCMTATGKSDYNELYKALFKELIFIPQSLLKN